MIAQNNEDKVASIVEVFGGYLGGQSSLIEQVVDDLIDSDRAVLDDGLRHTYGYSTEELPVGFCCTLVVGGVKDIEYLRWKHG